MRVVCISENAGWDGCDGPGVEKGKVYTVIDMMDGYGRFWWWPFPVKCYVLAGFPDDTGFPCRMFIEIIENEIDETELIKERVIYECEPN